MFCTECGQPMGDNAKFCAYCGTRRTVPAVGGEVAATAATPAVPATTPARTIRSTAEIMPIRVQRSSAPPPRVSEAGPIEADEPEVAGPSLPWPVEEETGAASPLFTAPEPAVIRGGVVRPTVPSPASNPAPPPVSETPAAERYSSVPFAASPALPDVSTERRKLSPVLIAAIVIALIALGGIVWMLRSSMAGGGKAAAASVGITIYPTAAKVAAGKSVDFAATVTGAPTSDVTWKVEEGGDYGQIQTRGAYSKEGSISLYSTYTAPKTPGTYHLVATSTADPSKSATAEITVTPK